MKKCVLYDDDIKQLKGYNFVFQTDPKKPRLISKLFMILFFSFSLRKKGIIYEEM